MKMGMMSKVSGFRLATAILAGAVGAAQAAQAAERGSSGDTTGIYGLVKDYATGLPIAGAMVKLVGAKSLTPIPVGDSMVTGPDGSFRFIGLAPLTEKGFGYVFQVRADRYWVLTTDLVNVSAGEMKRSDLACRKQIDLKVSIRDSSGASSSFRGAHIVLESMAQHDLPETAEADSSGQSEFGERTPGVYGVTVSMEGYRTRYLRDTLGGSVWDESLSVALEKLPAGSGKSIRGLAKNESGAPLNGFTVFFAYDAPEGRPLLYGESGLDGSFGIDGIPDACGSGTLFTIRERDSTVVTLTGAETGLTFHPYIPGVLEVQRERKPGAPVMRLRPWYLDYTLQGRKKRAP
jgi:hypothetical protein